jgi:hypothetical protein
MSIKEKAEKTITEGDIQFFGVRVWETENSYVVWTSSQEYDFPNKDRAERFCKGLRNKNGGAYAYELFYAPDDEGNEREPIAFWNRKE